MNFEALVSTNNPICSIMQSKTAQLKPLLNPSEIVGLSTPQFQLVDNEVVTIRQSPSDEFTTKINSIKSSNLQLPQKRTTRSIYLK